MTIDMGHSIGDALIVASLSALFGAWLYFKHVERRRRLEIIHQERLVAMEKGIPLPELPLETPPRQPDPTMPLLHGVVWIALSGGAMIALRLFPHADGTGLWALPLPMFLLGVGLMLYYVLVSRRSR